VSSRSFRAHAPAIVHRACPSPAPPPEPIVPDVDAGVILLVDRELQRDQRAAASTIAKRLQLDPADVRKALKVIASTGR
jgi:hypothetical protein